MEGATFVREAFADFLDDKEYQGVRPRAIDFYRRNFEYFLKDTGLETLEGVSEGVIRSWLLAHRHVSGATLATYDRSLCVTFNGFEKRGHVGVSPMALLPKRKAPKAIVDTFNRSELQEIVKIARAGRNPRRDVALVTLLLDTGVRIGEVTTMKLDDVIWKESLGQGEEVAYGLTLNEANFGSGVPAVVHGRALLDAPIDGSTGSYPLVVLSHGFATSPEWYRNLTEHYASYGFIVLAPEHADPEWGEGVSATIDRPRDIEPTLDHAEQITAPGGGFAGLIDMENVAVVGHSYGGYTTLAMAGAQFDLDALDQRCAELAPTIRGRSRACRWWASRGPSTCSSRPRARTCPGSRRRPLRTLLLRPGLGQHGVLDLVHHVSTACLLAELKSDAAAAAALAVQGIRNGYR